MALGRWEPVILDARIFGTYGETVRPTEYLETPLLFTAALALLIIADILEEVCHDHSARPYVHCFVVVLLVDDYFWRPI